MDEAEKIRIAELNLTRLLDWVGRVDTKASVVLGLGASMLGVLASLAPQPQLWTWRTVLFGVFSAVFQLASLFCVYLVNYPRTKGPSSSLNFFGGIASRTFREYTEAISKLTTSEYTSDVLEQCHRNAEIVSKKFAALKWAYRSLLVGVIPWAWCLYYFRALSTSR